MQHFYFSKTFKCLFHLGVLVKHVFNLFLRWDRLPFTSSNFDVLGFICNVNQQWKTQLKHESTWVKLKYKLEQEMVIPITSYHLMEWRFTFLGLHHS